MESKLAFASRTAPDTEAIELSNKPGWHVWTMDEYIGWFRTRSGARNYCVASDLRKYPDIVLRTKIYEYTGPSNTDKITKMYFGRTKDLQEAGFTLDASPTPEQDRNQT